MPDLPGLTTALAPVALAPYPLGAVPALLAGAAVASLGLPVATLRRLAQGALLGSAALILGAAMPVLRGVEVFSHVAPLFRVGSLDASLSLSLDAVSVPAALAVLVAGLLHVGRAAPTRVGVASLLATASALVVALLADGLPASFAGAGLALALGTLSARPLGAGRALAFGAGALALVAGSSLAAWALGGRWLEDGRYLSDYEARFGVTGDVAPLGRAPLPKERGRLTMITHPGAVVYVGVSDETQLTRAQPLAVSPFVGAEVGAGMQKIVVVPGGAAMVGGEGLEVALIDAVSVRPDGEVRVVVAGPTLVHRELGAQIAALGERLSSRRVGGLPAFPLAAWLVGLGLLALGASLVEGRGAGEGRLATVASGAAAVLVATWGARAAGIFGAGARWPLLVVVVLAGAALLAVRVRAGGTPRHLSILPVLALAASLAAPWAGLAVAVLGALWLGARGDATSAARGAPAEGPVALERLGAGATALLAWADAPLAALSRLAGGASAPARPASEAEEKP